MKLSRTSQNKIDQFERVARDPKKKSADVAFFKRELEKHVGKLEAALGAANLAQQQTVAASARSKRAALSRELEEAHIVLLHKGTGTGK